MTAPLDTPLPCPFCGEPPCVASNRVPYGERHVIACNCIGSVDCIGTTRAEALAKWNRRAPVRGVP